MAFTVVRTNASKLQTRPSLVCEDFECGLACDNVEEASRLIGKGGAALKVSVYPWGEEFDVVRNDLTDETEEENPGAIV